MTDKLPETIKALARKLQPRAVRLRRQLHQIPETAWEEHETSALLKRILKADSIPFRAAAKTGLIAEIRSGSGPCVAIRTDIDALPITEETGLPYKSRHPGRMHACGHDVHMATVTTAAMIVNRMRGEFSGTVRFLFQSSEEEPPGGAQALIAAGALERPRVDMILGLHVQPFYPTGTIAVRDGAFFAGVVDFNVEIIGKGGHGALPHLAVDPIVCAAQIVTAMQSIVARSVNPFEPAVITIGKIEGGTARNVIPPSCRLFGTARAQNKRTLQLLKSRIDSVAKSAAAAAGCRVVIDHISGYPPLINHPMANEYIVKAAQSIIGRRPIAKAEEPTMGGEDFARYLEHVPGAMFYLGVGNPKLGVMRNWHHPQFLADDAAIETGAAVLAQATIDFLNA